MKTTSNILDFRGACEFSNSQDFSIFILNALGLGIHSNIIKFTQCIPLSNKINDAI